MTYTEPLFNQISRFVISIGFGFIICILYFAVFFIRKTVSDKKWAVIVQDTVFGVIATVMSFFFMIIYNNGEVRLNLLTGEITGCLVLYFTIGRYILAVIEKASVCIRKVLNVLLLPLKIYLKAFKNFYITIKIKTKLKKDEFKERRKHRKDNCADPEEKAEKKIRKKLIKRKNIIGKPLKNQNKSV